MENSVRNMHINVKVQRLTKFTFLKWKKALLSYVKVLMHTLPSLVVFWNFGKRIHYQSRSLKKSKVL